MKAIRKKHHLFKAILALIIAVGLYIHCQPPSEQDIRASVVRIDGAHGMCTGEQVMAPSGQSYILTAAHCRILANDGTNFKITTEDGRKLERKFIEEDPMADILLIEGVPGLPALEIAPITRIKGQHVRTFTHGGAVGTHKTEGELIEHREIHVPLYAITDELSRAACTVMPKNHIEAYIDMFSDAPQDICVADLRSTITTAVIIPGSSGGPIVDDVGRLVGVASATDQQFGYLVPLDDIQSFLKNY